MNAQLQTIIDEAKARVDAHMFERPREGQRLYRLLVRSRVERKHTLAKINVKSSKQRDLKVDVGVTGSWGLSWMEPTVTVRSAAGTQTDALRERDGRACGRVPGSHRSPKAARCLSWPLGVVEGTATDDIPAAQPTIPWMQGQERRLMEFIGRHDPDQH